MSVQNGAKKAKVFPEVNFYVEENRKNHCTHDFEDRNLIVRRAFPIRFETNAPIDSVIFQYQGHSRSSNIATERTFAEVVLTPDRPSFLGWKLLYTPKKSKFEVVPPNNCIIGLWTTTVKLSECEVSSELIMLFNPFCEVDQVYLESVKEREEYVLKDTGLVFGAAAWGLDPEGWGWIFGQFDAKVLDCCLYLLDKSNLTTNSKSSPVLVCRAMSSLVNSNDNDGVLVGSWSGDYSNGTDPSVWTSSVDILRQYLETKRSVKYGQCWVFSGVLVTVLRALGIPCRSVTNYRSAHDTELNMAIDIYHDRRGNKIETDDSIWNFHLWNEVWIKRPDLPSGFDGWQALDATPQEMSEGMFQAGPASLKAIKSGLVYLPYDARFIFAEVNADRVYWHEDKNGYYVIKKTDKTHVGRMVVTKAVGSNDVMYITEQYKHEEGSWEERNQTRLAVTFGTEPDIYEYAENKDEVELSLKSSSQVIFIGESLEFVVNLKLRELKKTEIFLNVTASIYSYNGKYIANVLSMQKRISLPEHDNFQCSVLPESYHGKASSGNLLKISVMYDMKKPEDMGFLEEEIPFREPPPEIVILDDPPLIIYKPIKMKLIYKNYSSETLTGAFFTLSAPGHDSDNRLQISPPTVESGKECSVSTEYVPKRQGLVNLVVSFGADQQRGSQAYASLEVTDQSNAF